jgi:hypothetical protein
MNTKHTAVNNSAEGQIIKDLTTPPPNVAAPILALAFVIESIDLCNLSRLVVATNEGDPFRIADFQSE